MARCAAVDDNVYLLGGWDGILPMTSMEVYNISTGTWSGGTPLPVGRHSFACVPYNGKIYTFGGEDGAAPHNETYAFDIAANNWSAPLTPVPEESNNLNGTECNGLIYVFFINASLNMVGYAYDPGADTWSGPLAAPPDHRFGFGCVSSGGKIYLLGGTEFTTRSQLSIYDPIGDTWTVGLSLPTGRNYMGCVADGTNIFAIGGLTGGGRTDITEVYNILSNTWYSTGSMIEKRSFTCAALAQNRIFIMSGRTDLTNYSTTMESYSLISDYGVHRSLEPLAVMPARAGSIITAANGRILAAGGSELAATAASDAYTLQFGNDIGVTGPFTIANTWTGLTPMNTSRAYAGSAEYSGLVYAAGGMDDGGTELDSIEVYDSGTDTWTTLGAAMGTVRSGLGGVRIGTKLYLFGGDTGGGTKTGVMEILDLTTDTFDAGPFDSMNTPRSHFGYALEPMSGCIYVFGGEGNGSSYLDSVEKYDPVADTWTTIGTALPYAVKGALVLYENYRFHMFGGEIDHPSAGAMMIDRIYSCDKLAGTWKEDETILPYAARDMYGCTTTYTWSHRGKNHTEEYCFIGGGFNGTDYKGGFYRYYSR
jgi:N-acetylneuraminic acid mutarotase